MNTTRRTITESIGIAAAPAAIFDVLVDLDQWSVLDAALVDISPRTPLVLGSRGTITRRVARSNVTTEWTIVAFEPGKRFTNRVVGRGYELVEQVDLVPDAGGTRVDIEDDLRATSLVGRLMVPFSAGIVRRDLEARTMRLKQLIEGSGAGQPIGQ